MTRLSILLAIAACADPQHDAQPGFTVALEVSPDGLTAIVDTTLTCDTGVRYIVRTGPQAYYGDYAANVTDFQSCGEERHWTFGLPLRSPEYYLYASAVAYEAGVPVFVCESAPTLVVVP